MRVTFDECGYTGQHLLDKEQPVFVLASVSFEDAAAADLLGPFAVRRQGEFKYAKVKRATRDQPMILSVLDDPRLNSQTCKAYIIHKPFMLVSKLVDEIFETLAHEHGLDLYEGRAALATANLIASTFPVYLGRTRYQRFLGSFSALARKQDQPAFERFAAESESIYNHLEQKFPYVSSTFAPVVLACRRGLPFLRRCFGDFGHDPIIPAYHVLANEWSKELNSAFELLADESKVLAHERQRLLKFSDPTLKNVELKQYSAIHVYPLKISDIVLGRSEDHPSIQLADFLSGVTFHAFNNRAQGTRPTAFEEESFKRLVGSKLFCGGIWPSTGVTPEEVEAIGEYSGSIVDYTMKILSDDPSVRKK
ncbi:MAG: hypothetical protein QOH39_2772 [Verrucomicrobiota bacterium]|jgi:hypothetical protein